MKTEYKIEEVQTLERKTVKIHRCESCDFESRSFSETAEHEASHLDVEKMVINGHKFYKAKDAKALKQYINATHYSDDTWIAWKGKGWYGLITSMDDPIHVVPADQYIKDIKEQAIKDMEQAIKDCSDAEKLEKEFATKVYFEDAQPLTEEGKQEILDANKKWVDEFGPRIKEMEKDNVR